MDTLKERERLASMTPNYKPKASVIMEDFRTGLCFPFHINHAARTNDIHYFNPKINDFHTHDFYEVVVIANDEKQAFYLTDEDKIFYSQQEIEVLEKILISQ